MTTVVCDGEFIASDSQQNCDFVIPFSTTCKFKGDPNGARGQIVAAAGLADWCDAFSAWVIGTRKARPMHADGDNGVAAVFDGVGWQRYACDTKLSHSMANKWAIGSGAPYANTALVLGHDAITAVYAAIQLDPYSGGPIFYASLNELLTQGNAAIKTMTHEQAKERSRAG